MKLITAIIRPCKLGELREALMQAGETGKVADGKIFISSIDSVVRLRTGKLDADAL